MYKKDVIDHFGTQRAVAKALGISDAAVSQWKEVIPEKDAYRNIKVQAITIEKAVWFFFRLCCFNLLNGEHG